MKREDQTDKIDQADQIDETDQMEQPNRTTDQSVLQRINELVGQEHQLLAHETKSEEDQRRLRDLQVELDQCWDLLRQRRALLIVGQDADKAEVRPPEIVEEYEQ